MAEGEELATLPSLHGLTWLEESQPMSNYVVTQDSVVIDVLVGFRQHANIVIFSS